jgi:hypothetical protein
MTAACKTGACRQGRDACQTPGLCVTLTEIEIEISAGWLGWLLVVLASAASVVVIAFGLEWLVQLFGG